MQVRDGLMNVLVVDGGGSHGKILATGQEKHGAGPGQFRGDKLLSERRLELSGHLEKADNKWTTKSEKR
jgi:hypothetical protein